MNCDMCSMRARRVSTLFLALLCALCAFARASLAGDLAPPAGPVAPTPGPEPRIAINATNTPGDADSIFRILQPGSYYLAGNVTGEFGKYGIKIVVAGGVTNGNVTIDLMGFSMRGVAGSLAGIVCFGNNSNVTIRNGSVWGWGQDGIDCDANNFEYGRLIENVHASANGGSGISVGRDGIARACTASFNTTNGFTGANNSQFESCTARENGNNGFSIGVGGLARGCTARSNAFDGFNVQVGASIIDCIAASNLDEGIASAGQGIASRCVCNSNGGHGIECVAATMQVFDCVCDGNAGDGIKVQSFAIVRSNVCRGNGAGTADGAGIHATSVGNSIDSNTVASNDRGIDVDLTGNLISRNTARGNAVEFDIVAGNGAGPIVTAANVATNTNPNANFDL